MSFRPKSLVNSTYNRPPPNVAISPGVASSIRKSPNIHLDGALTDIKRRYEEEARHVQMSYEADFNKHVSLLKAIEELEVILDEERRRGDELEHKYKNTAFELENERRIRMEIEHENLALQEELRRAEAVIGDQEAKINALQRDLAHADGENKNLKQEVNRLTEMYGVKLRELEDKYILQLRDLNAEVTNLRGLLERQRTEYENRLRDLDRDWSGKCARLEEMLRERDSVIVDLENEVRRLRDHISQLKIEFEEELRRQIAMVREEETRRFQMALRDLESRLQQAEMEREGLARENDKLVRDLNAKEKQIHDMKLQFDSEIARLRSEISDLRSQLSALTITNENLKREIAARESTIARMEGDLMNMEREIARLKDEVNRLVAEHAAERRRWEENERVLKGKIDELERILRPLEADNAKLRADLERLKGNLANAVQKSILSTFVGAVGSDLSPSALAKPSYY